MAAMRRHSNSRQERAPKTDSPELLDRIIGNMQDGLAFGLPWLDKAYGRAERLVKFDAAGRRIYTPNVYGGGNDYIPVTPDAEVGNFCFFWVEDPQQVDWERNVSIGLKATFSVIFWLDFRTIFNDSSIRDKETVKRQILNLLNGGFWLRAGSIRINRVYELVENIYRGFSLDETENLFLMHPFGGFRFEGVLSISETCNL